jgi:hypothetical protein
MWLKLINVYSVNGTEDLRQFGLDNMLVLLVTVGIVPTGKVSAVYTSCKHYYDTLKNPSIAYQF